MNTTSKLNKTKGNKTKGNKTKKIKLYSKEQYQDEIKKWDLGSYKIRKQAEKLFWELYYKIPRRFAMIKNSTNVTGDNIQATKNSYMCFDLGYGENVLYSNACHFIKDSVDCSYSKKLDLC